MFPRNRVTGVTGSRINTESRSVVQRNGVSAPRRYSEASTEISASLGGLASTGSANSMSVNSYWSSQYQYYMTGLIPSEPGYADTSQLALFYRDIYLHDHTAGSAVDIQSTFPFSDFDLRGLDEDMLRVYRESVDQLNINQMLPIISTAYLTDGFFAGSLVFDPKAKKFIDTLMHDALQCQILPNPFFNAMPQINIHTSESTNEMLKSDSQYSQEYLSFLPQSFITLLKRGAFTLNPVSTLYVARRSLTDRAYVSFLHRILPMYLIEKTMYRGTLVEASRRQRATTHLTAGDDVWTPTGEELQALVSQFQQAEFDPLGGWVSTRNAVQVNDIRSGGDFWKWTDMSDILVAYKLRALGISESFLSGEASYAAAESAYSTFLESQDTYRRHLTNSIFDTTLFPLIAIANGYYKKGTEATQRVQHGQITKFLMHSTNRSRLQMPQLVWHKSLEAKGEENTFEMLEQASEKGVPIPLRMWMAAAGIDVESLTKDLREDQELRSVLQKYTGKDTSHEGEEQVEASLRKVLGLPTTASMRSKMYHKRSILGRNWDTPEDFIVGKTGQKKASLHNATGKRRDANANIAEMAERMRTDPNYRMQVAKENARKGRGKIALAGDAPIHR